MSSSSEKSGRNAARFAKFLRTRKRIWIPALVLLVLAATLLTVILVTPPLDRMKFRLTHADYTVIIQTSGNVTEEDPEAENVGLCSRRLVMRHKTDSLRTIEIMEFYEEEEARAYYDLLKSGKYIKKISATAGTDGFLVGRTVVYGNYLAVKAAR